MIKKLRVKFICIVMAIAMLMVGSILGLVLYFTGQIMEMQSINMMRTIATTPFQHGNIGNSNDEVRLPLTAAAGGWVKAVYAAEGDDVAAVMTEHGALAVISLDDMMAVKIETKASLSAGDRVWVGFEDGTEVSGRVESAFDGTAVITVADEGYAIGAKAVVTDSNDKKLGAGELYVHHAWNAAAYSGTVSGVNLKEGTAVSAGKSLFTLKNVENSSEFETLSRQHRDYEELMLELFVMYQSGFISAPCDGDLHGQKR